MLLCISRVCALLHWFLLNRADQRVSAAWKTCLFPVVSCTSDPFSSSSAQKHLLFNLSTLFYLNVLDAHGWFEKEMVASTCCKRDSPVSKSNEEQISREVNRKPQGDQGIGEGSWLNIEEARRRGDEILRDRLRFQMHSRHSPQLALLFESETARLALLAGLHRLLKLTFSFYVLRLNHANFYAKTYKDITCHKVWWINRSSILKFQDFWYMFGVPTVVAHI